MSYAIKIPNVNFSSVAVGQVTYIEEVPCTGIELSDETLSFVTVEEQKTLTAILAPADTTDALTWASSDENIATVVDGVVTIHGIGSATITATCGNQSATCSINQTSLKARYTYTTVSGKTCGSISGVDDKKILGISTLATQSVGGQAYTGANDLRIRGGDTSNVECIRVPYGATYAKISISSGSVSYIEVVDTESLLNVSGVVYPEWVKNATFPFSGGSYAVEYGQAFALRGPSEGIEAVQYVYFE